MVLLNIVFESRLWPKSKFLGIHGACVAQVHGIRCYLSPEVTCQEDRELYNCNCNLYMTKIKFVLPDSGPCHA